MPISESPDRGIAGLAHAGQAKACGESQTALKKAAAKVRLIASVGMFMKRGAGVWF
jgi:hypothetical protein